jgi:sugar phosphate isomerase/epimerase
MFERLFIHTPYHLLDEALPLLADLGVAPEIYFNAAHLDRLAGCEEQLVKAADRLAELELPCSFHGPFLDLSPAAADERIVAVTRERFRHLFRVAELFRPRVIVLHSGYERWRFNLNIDLWLEKSVPFWRPLAAEAEALGTALAIENIFETTPGGLRLLFDEIASPAFGGCFDIGHWNLFAKMDLSEWLALLKDHLVAFHLHDNRGSFDDHLVPGDGQIDFSAFRLLIENYAIRARVHTFELHRREDLARGVAWFRENHFLVDGRN